MLIAEIQAHVAARFRIPGSFMRSPHKARVYARPRQVAMYLARTHTGKSLPVIARAFQRDHTTVLTGIRQIERLRADDPAFDATVREIERGLGG